MNTLKLSLENFQAVSRGILEFKTGLNFIVGQSNSGKTATFRALKDCLLNPNKAARHISNGTSQAVVTLEYNGNTIEWRRTPKSSTYTINGQEYVKVGRSDVFKLLEDSGFVQGSSGVIMNIEEELQLPFPFGMSKQELFKLYEDVFCISDSAVILKAAKGREEEIKFEISNLESANLKNEKKIEELNKFKEEVDLDFLRSRKAYLKSNRDRLTLLKDGLPEIRKANEIQGITLSESEYSFTDLLPEYQEKLNLSKLASTLKKLHNLKFSSLEGFEISKDLVNKIKEAKELKATIEKLRTLDSVTFTEFTFSSRIPRYEELKELRDAGNLLKRIKAFELPEFSVTVDFQRYKELKELSALIKDGESTTKVKEGELNSIEGRIKELSSLLKEFKVCPLCHRPLEE